MDKDKKFGLIEALRGQDKNKKGRMVSVIKEKGAKALKPKTNKKKAKNILQRMFNRSEEE